MTARLSAWLVAGLAAAIFVRAAHPQDATAQSHSLPSQRGQTQDERAQRAAGLPERVDIITPHITDSHEMELPCFKPGFACHVELPRWRPIQLWPGVFIDMSPTKHVVMLWIAGGLCLLLVVAARVRRRPRDDRPPRGFASGIEAVVLYMRNEIILPNVGHHGDKYVPFILTLFFFILFVNLLGLVPYGSTATGNISVTAMLAIVTFIVVELAGMRALGRKYIGTIVFWPHDMPLAMKLPMTFVMTPVELLGKFTKPFALAIRLFANMTAGHVIVLALISMIFTFGRYWIAPLPFLMAVAVMLLELFVAFLQAFIFALLSAVFIGQIREAAH